MSSKMIVKELTRLDRPALERHFLSLGSDDRRLRFGIALSDPGVRAYVSRIDFERDAAFAVLDQELHLLGAAHLAREKEYAELGVSVLPGHRGRGIGGALLARAHTHARNWGLRTLFMHCLTENGAIMHLARKQGMQIVAESGEADARLLLPAADASSYLGAAFEQRVALFDHALKTQLANARRLGEALTSRTRSPVPEK
jgi:GNAT superfamily N-acetyltransferase